MLSNCGENALVSRPIALNTALVVLGLDDIPLSRRINTTTIAPPITSTAATTPTYIIMEELVLSDSAVSLTTPTEVVVLDGGTVGLTDGASEGDWLGERENILVGEIDGFRVGPGVGDNVGV